MLLPWGKGLREFPSIRRGVFYRTHAMSRIETYQLNRDGIYQFS